MPDPSYPAPSAEAALTVIVALPIYFTEYMRELAGLGLVRWPG